MGVCAWSCTRAGWLARRRHHTHSTNPHRHHHANTQTPQHQVIIVGDLNIASQPRDVHDAITWATLYDPAELAALHGIIDAHGSNCEWSRLRRKDCLKTHAALAS
jgi:exonuclease III